MTMPTQDVIEEEILRLKEMKPKVRHFDIFGGDNHAKIDAMIDVLEGEVEDEDAIYDKWSDEDDADANMDLISNARAALSWVDGEEDAELPSKGWESLLIAQEDL